MLINAIKRFGEVKKTDPGGRSASVDRLVPLVFRVLTTTVGTFLWVSRIVALDRMDVVLFFFC